MKRIVGLLLLYGLIVPITASAEVREVVVTFKTHFDIGYTDLASNVVQRYRTTMIDQALKVVEQNRGLPPEQQFVWTIPGWPMSKILEDWPGQTPERKQQIVQAFQDGRFVVHALPFTLHTELLEPEDLVRGLGFASRLSRDAGLALPRDAKMTDVPCHSWILPTLLKHAGVDFLHLGCNAASSSPDGAAAVLVGRPGRLAAADDVLGGRLRHRARSPQGLALPHLAGPGAHRRQPRPAHARRGPEAAHGSGPEAPRREGPHRTAVRLRRRDPRRESRHPGGSRRHARHLDSRPDVRSRRREDRPQRPARSRLCGIAEYTAGNLGRVCADGWQPQGRRPWGWRRAHNHPQAALEAATRTIAEARENSLLYGEHTWGGALVLGHEVREGREVELRRRLEGRSCGRPLLEVGGLLGGAHRLHRESSRSGHTDP